MNYKIVRGGQGDYEKMANAVQLEIDAGWKPQGGVVAVYNSIEIILYQALIKP